MGKRKKDFGWGNNKNIVMMKSKDLINWTHWLIRMDQISPEFNEIGCAWAPELIFDQLQQQTMMYWTTRFKNGPNKMYGAYLSPGLTSITSKPKLLFQYPKTSSSYIDADITQIGTTFHMLYVPHDGTPGIKHAVSNHIDSGYVYSPHQVDPEAKACEAPNIFKRIGENKWVLVYDIYGIQPNNFGFSETQDFKKFTDLGRFNEGKMRSTNFSSPKHPSIIQLKKKELQRLVKAWKLPKNF